MEQISFREFKKHFCGESSSNRKFCFILGSGASKNSGIPTGAELVQQWMTEINDKFDPETVSAWKDQSKITDENLAENYSSVFDMRFKLYPKEGYQFLENIMEGKNPSCGYSMLAQILTQTPHNIVITTNFDSLTEDALFIYTEKKPLIVGHESLASYIDVLGRRPIVVKIHRDLYYKPDTTVDNTSILREQFKNSLHNIFKYYTPVVIGYGGNDGSLMGFLGELGRLENKIFWCFLEKENEPPTHIQQVIENLDGFAVPITGFDDVMIQLGDELEFGRMDKKIVEIAEERADIYRKQIEALTNQQDTTEDTKESLHDIVERGDKDWWYYEQMAQKEPDIAKRNQIYLDGLTELPSSGELNGAYALFLKNKKGDKKTAAEYYKKSVNLSPNNALLLGNYAIFLHTIIGDYDQAEKFYKKAKDINPTYTNNLGNYAIFLNDVRGDIKQTKIIFDEILKLEPDSTAHLANFIKILIENKEFKLAQKNIPKAFSGKPDSFKETILELWFYCYAVFWQEYPQAEQEIEKLLEDDVQSIGWPLQRMLEIAQEHGHPNYPKLCEYAKRITEA